MRPFARLAAAAVILVAATACSAPEPAPSPSPTTPTTGSPEPEGDDALAQQCANDRFSLSYPSGWVTNSETAGSLPPCSLFDPDDVAVEPGTEVPLDIAFLVRVTQGPFEGDDAGDTAEELSRQELTIDGRRAARVELRATGEGLYPAGTLTTLYKVDLGDEVLLATTHDAGAPSYEAKQDLLADMMATLRVTG